MKFQFHLNAGMNEHMRFDRIPEADTRVRKPSEYSALHKQVVRRPNGPPTSTNSSVSQQTGPSLDVQKRSKRKEKEQRSDTGAGQSPSTHVDKARLRHSERTPTFVPEHWRPGMGEDSIEGHICWSTVNFHPKPNRYYRGVSTQRFVHPDLTEMLYALNKLLREDQKRMIDHFSMKEVLEGELWDQEAINAAASTLVSVHGWLFRAPIVVAACVEEIYQRGMGTLDLFDVCSESFTKMCNDRDVQYLLAAFDHSQDDTSLPDLTRVDIKTVAHLLGHWINSNPEPLMHRSFCNAFSAWCAEPSVTREREFKEKIHTKQRVGEDGECYSETDTEAEALDEELKQSEGLPSSRKMRKQKRQRKVERAERAAFAKKHPEQVIMNRPTHRQRRMQMYRELKAQEGRQLLRARLMLLLLAPHCSEVMVYLMTFLASLMDHPENKISAEILAERFAHKLFGGPNDYVARNVMEWLLPRWDQIVAGFRSPEARSWERQRNADDRRCGSQEPPAQPTLPQRRQPQDDEPAPPYRRGSRRTSDASDRSAAPSYHSTCDEYPQPAPAQSSATPNFTRSSTHLSTLPRRGSEHPSDDNSRRWSAASETRPSICRASVTTSRRVEKFRSESCEYEAEGDDDDDDWNEPQRAELAEIHKLMGRPTCSRVTSTCSVQSESVASVYSQDDDSDVRELDIINDYSRQPQPVSRRQPPQSTEAGITQSSSNAIATANTAGLNADDAKAELKRQLKQALREQQLAQQRVAELYRQL